MHTRLVSASKFKWNDLENCQGWRCARKLVYGEAVAQDLALIGEMEPVGISRRKELDHLDRFEQRQMPGMADGAAVFRRAGVIVGRLSPGRLRRQHAACNQQHQRQLSKVSEALSHSFDYIGNRIVACASARSSELQFAVTAAARDSRLKPQLHAEAHATMRITTNLV